MLLLSRSISSAVLLLVVFPALGVGQSPSQGFPVTLKPDDVHEMSELKIVANGLTISAKDILVVPIRCEPGITGAMLLGHGDFSFSPNDADPIRGQFRAAMLRFAPGDQENLLPLANGKVVTDRSAHAMSEHLMENLIGHCWKYGTKNGIHLALIPDAGSFAAAVYSPAHGDLLLSTTPHSAAVHNFTDGQTLYMKK